ncbi:MAG TPA: PAS domain-containing protein [Polyangia bacterium]|nr:PAS domain-containing protein [Polyangia bacterium]
MGIENDLETDLAGVERLSPQEINALPVGTIKLDRDGRVLVYNTAEERLAGFSAANVLGKNFFTEVAPCTKVQEFYGRFREGLERRELHTKFRFTFRFAPPRAPEDVWITLFYSASSDAIWVFVRR